MPLTPRPPSRSAMLTAAARAAHRDEPPPWILDDPYAAGLAGKVGMEMIDLLRRRVSAEGVAGFVTWVCLRGRFTDDLVEQAIDQGIRQHVILGAGLDSSAYRHAAWLKRVTVFEVDHEASQAWKRSALDRLRIEAPANVVFCPVDFEHETIGDSLARGGFDATSPAVISWIGVSMYLTADAIAATLKYIAGLAPGSILVMTYNQPLGVVDAFSREVTGAIAAAVAEGGEPFLSLFEPRDTAALVRSHGFIELEDIGADDLRLRYLGDRPDLKVPGAQRVLVARVP